MVQWRRQSSAPNPSLWGQQNAENFNRNRQFQNAPQNYPNINNNKNCNYCIKIGHTINECRRRAYNESLKQQQQPRSAEKKEPGKLQTPPRSGCNEGDYLKSSTAPTSNHNIINTKINLHSDNTIPSIMVSANGLKNPARMMIDIGAGRNLIKLNMIENDIEINQNGNLRFTGINNVPVYTLGQITLNIFGYPTIFNLIPNSVPVDEDGGLGSEFFIDNDVNIN